MKSLKYTLFFILFVFSYVGKSQQNDYQIKNLSVKEGLSQSTVYCILQDRKGFMWFGTQDGLNRYDGYNFEKIRINKFGNKIPENIINCMEPDMYGRIWIGTYAGLYIYDLVKEEIDYTFLPDSDTLFKSNKIAGLLSDSVYMYIITQNAIIRTHINNRESKILKYLPNNDKSILPFYNMPLTKAGDSILLCANKKLYIHDKRMDTTFVNPDYNNIKIHAFYNTKDGLIMKGTEKSGNYNCADKLFCDTTIYTIQDYDQHIWIGTDVGLFITDNTFKQRKSISELPKDWYLDFYLDNTNNLWIATYSHGIYFLRPNIQTFKNDLPLYSEVMSIFEKGDSLWIGTRHDGLHIYHKQKEILRNISSYCDNFVSSIIQINNEIWVSSSHKDYTNNQISVFLKDSVFPINHLYKNRIDSSRLFLEGNRVYRIFQDRNNSVWLGTAKGIFKLDIESMSYSFFQSPTATSFYQEMDNELFIGTYDGLFIYNYILDSLRRIDIPIQGGSIHSVLKDNNNHYWIGTNYGLSLLNKQFAIINNFTQKDGLSSDFIYEIIRDSSKRIYYSSNNGIGYINISNNIIATFDCSDGLQNLEYNVGASYKNKNGYIYFGGLAGVSKFHPDSVYINQIEPAIRITKVVIIDNNNATQQIVHHPKNGFEINLKYTQNSITFYFSALDFQNPKSNHYEYQLQGFDDDYYRTTGKDPKAVYTNISDGKYTFIIKGSNSDGIWNSQPTSIIIDIESPYYKKWWFILAIFSIIVFIVNESRKLITNREKIKHYNNLETEREKLEVLLKKETKNLKNAQANLVDTKMKSARAEFIASITHEINTPIGIAVTGLTTFGQSIDKVLRKYKNKSLDEYTFIKHLNDTKEISDLTYKNISRAAKLVNNLREISKDQITKKSRKIELIEYLQNLADILQPEWKRAKLIIELVAEVDSLYVNTVPGLLSQIFTNLIVNSVRHGFNDFIDRKGGKIMIELKKRGNRLFISYKDNGNGITKENESHIFEAHFSTIPERGSGLGMFIVKNIINNQLNGSIKYIRPKNNGVIFNIEISLLK